MTDAHLSAMRQACDRADQILKDYFLKTLKIEEKEGEGLVSEADRTTEKAIFEVLYKKFPEIGFLGEEGGRQGDSDESLIWVVDPLDGTHNFVSGFPIFCTSLALVKAGVPVAGIVSAPLLQTRFEALRGKGAFSQGRKLEVSRKNLDRSLLATGFSYQRGASLDRQLSVFIPRENGRPS